MGERATIAVLIADGVWYQLMKAAQRIHMIIGCSSVCGRLTVVVLCTLRVSGTSS